MPSDLALKHSEKLIYVRGRRGGDLPFSKGLMATSILATGMETGTAHMIAAGIEKRLRQEKRREVDADELAALAEQAIEVQAGKDAANRYRAWRRVKRVGRPIVVCLGGAPGVGKSTVATRLALRLGINRVVPSDAVREVLRTVVPQTVLPELHVSTYETVEGDPAIGCSLTSFLRQSHAVGSACAAIASRLTAERRHVLLEGAHVLPGKVRDHLEQHGSDAIVVEVLLTIDQEDTHREQLTTRLSREPDRDGQRHLKHLPVIRLLQEELRKRAHKAGVAEHDIRHPEDLTQRVVDLIIAQIDATKTLPKAI